MASPADLIQKVRQTLEKKYKDSSELFPDFSSVKQIDVIPSPSAIINAVTGIGGMPRGRVTEIYGPFSSGKTTIAAEICAEAQRNDPKAVALYVDYEHAFDARYAKALGVDLSSERFIFTQPEYFEQGAQIVDAFVEEGLVDIIVLDSAAAMTPRSELEGEFDKEGGSQKGVQAALMAQFLAVITKKLNRGRKPALVIINQTRAVINIGGRPQKNAPREQSAGGNGLKFYTSLRLELEIVNSEGDANRGTKGTDQIYTQNRVRVTATKNKLAPPFVRGVLVIEYGKGINNIASIAELAEARLGIMSGAGFFKYNGDSAKTSFSCRGRDAFVAILTENPDTRKEIERKVLDDIKAEHAKALGIQEIKTTGKAKEVSGESGTLVLSAKPRTQPTYQDHDDTDEDDNRDPEDKPRGLTEPGLPTED